MFLQLKILVDLYHLIYMPIEDISYLSFDLYFNFHS